MSPARRTLIYALFFGCVLLAAIVGSIGVGSRSIPPPVVIDALIHGGESSEVLIVREIRLPRAVVGALVGLNLGLAGVLLQGVMRNPLASPEIVGVTAGAGLGASIVIAFVPELGAWISASAFVCALGAGLAVYALSYRRGVGTNPTATVLAGVAVSATIGGVTTGIVVASNQAQSIVGWMAGSAANVSWRDIWGLLGHAVGGLLLTFLLRKRIDILGLGDDVAVGLGVRPEQTRFVALAGACALAASAVSVVGLVGFIGLMVPHIAGLLVGSKTGPKMIISALAGALLFVFADTVARVPSPQLPVAW